MIFLDTCIWIELLGVRTPVKVHEIQQARSASGLLNEVIAQNRIIVTCKEQLLELISAIEKVTMRTANKHRKENNLSGIGNLKEFRKLEEFRETKELCASVISDVRYFATIKDLGEYNMDFILQRLELADINDCLYYDYCTREGIDFYTFDSDLKDLGNSRVLHRYCAESDTWS